MPGGPGTGRAGVRGGRERTGGAAAFTRRRHRHRHRERDPGVLRPHDAPLLRGGPRRRGDLSGTGSRTRAAVPGRPRLVGVRLWRRVLRRVLARVRPVRAAALGRSVRTVGQRPLGGHAGEHRAGTYPGRSGTPEPARQRGGVVPGTSRTGGVPRQALHGCAQRLCGGDPALLPRQRRRKPRPPRPGDRPHPRERQSATQVLCPRPRPSAAPDTPAPAPGSTGSGSTGPYERQGVVA